jgi:hypothetical protein
MSRPGGTEAGVHAMSKYENITGLIELSHYLCIPVSIVSAKQRLSQRINNDGEQVDPASTSCTLRLRTSDANNSINCPWKNSIMYD